MRVGRESALYYGDVGSGKTLAVLDIAHTHPDHIFHYIKADRDIDKLMEHYPEYDFANVMEYSVYQYEEIIQALAKIFRIINPLPPDQQAKNWVVFDTIGQLYRRTRDDLSLAQYGLTWEDLIAERLKAKAISNVNAPQGVKGNIDNFDAWEWRIITNTFFGNIINPLFMRTRANIVYISHQLAIKDVGFNGPYVRPVPHFARSQGRFEAIGVIPDVNKRLSEMVDTILHFSVDQDSTVHTLYTLKDTGPRNWLNEPTPFGRFWQGYSRLVLDARPTY